MPRKLPSSTKFVKNERYTTFAPVQRISASSRNSMRNDSRIRRTRSLLVAGELSAESGVSRPVVSWAPMETGTLGSARPETPILQAQRGPFEQVVAGG